MATKRRTFHQNCFETTASCGRLIIGTKAGTAEDDFLSARAMLPGRKAQPLSRQEPGCFRASDGAFCPGMSLGKKEKLIRLYIHPHNLPFYQVRLGERLLQTFSFFNDQTGRLRPEAGLV
ncbi:MAG: hypothetical protein K9K64_16545 [Desulfohalobiaceae bacterium]|nr:hypothetical protein [Desulfohalobiaceae bacterium]